jgi:hypothetical protein
VRAVLVEERGGDAQDSASAEACACGAGGLGHNGLHPCFYREIGAGVKRAFLRKLFSDDTDGKARRQTASLILTTVAQTAVKGVETLRQCRYTGLLPTGKRAQRPGRR